MGEEHLGSEQHQAKVWRQDLAGVAKRVDSCCERQTDLRSLVQALRLLLRNTGATEEDDLVRLVKGGLERVRLIIKLNIY